MNKETEQLIVKIGFVRSILLRNNNPRKLVWKLFYLRLRLFLDLGG